MFDGTVYLASGLNSVQISGQTVIGQISGQLVAVSGLIATSISGNMVSVSGQAISVSGNMVSTSGQAHAISGQTIYFASGQNNIATFTPATYTAFFDNVVPTSGGVMAAVTYKSGVNVISLKKLFITNIEPALISGQYVRFDICRISGLFSGGTAISAFPFDPTDVSSGASINMVAAPAGASASLFPVAARNVLFNWATTTAGWMSGGALASLAGSLNQLSQSFNIIPESTEMKEIRLTSGYGVMVQQSLAQTNYTQVTSGKYAVTMVYTLQ
jgi:hypothetical protein